eukprot:SAG11_NODE_6295_length_1343_cov_1.284566_2_plen_78_part_00
MLYMIGSADCFGGWEKIISDVGYTGTGDSGEVNFVAENDYARIAVVRKSGYVSCDCNSNPACGAGTEGRCALVFCYS